MEKITGIDSPSYKLHDSYMEFIDYPNCAKCTDSMRICYVLYNNLTKLCKIGITNNLYTRIGQLKTASGMDIDLLFAIQLEPGYDEHPKTIEKFLHSYYKSKRRTGEWFAFTLRDVFALYDLFLSIDGDYFWDKLRHVINKYKND